MQLRLTSSRAPYWRGGRLFEPATSRSFGLVMVDLAELRDGDLADLLLDPHVDVMAGSTQAGWWPVSDEADLALVTALLATAAPDDAARLVIEQGRDGGPMGDEPAPGAVTADAETAALLAQARSPGGIKIKVRGQPATNRKPAPKPAK